MASSTVYLLLLKFAALALCRHVFSPAPTTLFQQGSISPLATTTPLAVLPRENPPPLLTNSATCGYTSGLWFSAFACPSEFTCNYYTTPYSAPNFGCCSSGDGCGYVSTCLNYNTSGNLNTGAGVLVDGENFFCGSDLPYCVTVVLYGQTYSSGGTYSFLWYSCQTGRSTMITAYQTTTQEFSISPSSKTSSAPTSSANKTSLTTSLPTTAASTSAAAATHGLSESVRIAIGVGVGIFAAGSLIATSFWVWHRRKIRPDSHPNAPYHLPNSHCYYHNGAGAASGYSGAHYDAYPHQALQERDYNVSRPVELTSSPRVHELGDNNLNGVSSVRHEN